MDAHVPKGRILRSIIIERQERLALPQLGHLTAKPKPPVEVGNGKSYHQMQNGEGGNYDQDQRQVIPTTQDTNLTITRPSILALKRVPNKALQHHLTDAESQPPSSQKQKTSVQHDTGTISVQQTPEALFLQSNQRQRRDSGHSKQFSTTTEVIQKTTKANLSGCCYACIDYSMADGHAAKFPRHSVTSIKILAKNLTSPFQDPVLKARVIFSWFFDNIVYDTKSYFGGNVKYKKPKETLRTGLAVCQGFAELYQKLGQYAGLEVIVIPGHGKGNEHSHPGDNVPSFSSNHAWNAVRLNGKWKLIDPCWGAGHVNESLRYEKCFNPKYFTQSPEVFRLEHFPTNPAHQLCSSAISWEEYIMMKEGPTIYTGIHEKGFNDAELLPNLKRIPKGRPTKFVVKSLCQHHQIKPEDRYVIVLKIDENYIPLRMEVEGSVWSVEMSSLNRGSVTLYYVDKLGGHSAKGITVEEYEASITRMGVNFTGMAQWEVY